MSVGRIADKSSVFCEKSLESGNSKKMKKA